MTISTAAVVQLFGYQQAHDAQLRQLQQSLADATTIAKFAELTRTFQLSKPLVAAFEATPGFTQALKSFPNQNLLNLVAEHPSSPSSVAALESFSVAEGEQVNTLATRATGLTVGFDQLLESITNTASSLREQITTVEEKFDIVGDVDDLIANTPVTSLSDSAYSTILTTVNEHLGRVTRFNSDELRAHPDRLSDEVQGFTALASSLGPVLGFTLGEYGLVDAKRAPDYEVGTSSFVGMGLTKTSLLYHLTQAQEVLNVFDLVAHQRDHLVESLRAEAQAMPDQQNTDETAYGFEAHSVLIGCYTGFVTKLIMSGVYAITMLLQVSDAVLADVGH